MLPQNRKSFLKTLGLMGAGTLMAGPALSLNNNNTDATRLSATDTNCNKQAKRVLRVANLTDIHVKEDRIAEYGMAAALLAVNQMEDKADFIINGGDAIMNAGLAAKGHMKAQWNTFNRVLRDENSLPVYNCLGNHDLFGFILPNGNLNESKRWAIDEYRMSNRYYSFSQNGWKFIVLDSTHPRKSVPGYVGKLDKEQFAWLENELRNAGSEHVCIVTHIPILSICCLFDHSIPNADRMKILDTNMHADWGELVNLFYQYKNVRACISGHIHLVDYINYLGVEYFCNGAVAGEWWKGKYQQFDPAFCMMNFFEDGTVTREVNYYKWNS